MPPEEPIISPVSFFRIFPATAEALARFMNARVVTIYTALHMTLDELTDAIAVTASVLTEILANLDELPATT